MRGRGSKQEPGRAARDHARRPPCGGADRNCCSHSSSASSFVAPRAGARIETMAPRPGYPLCSSPPVRGRGSKPRGGAKRSNPNGRPPCGGADRNIINQQHSQSFASRPPCGGADRNGGSGEAKAAVLTSPPVRGRGSKQRAATRWPIVISRPPCGGADRNRACRRKCGCSSLSPPVRGRGSKHGLDGTVWRIAGRPPCGGADRNTTRPPPMRVSGCRPPCGGADRNGLALTYLRDQVVAPRAGARIETFLRQTSGALLPRRPPCGGADRNILLLPGDIVTLVAPRAGARIETAQWAICLRLGWSPPVRGRGSKLELVPALVFRRSRPPCGGADRNEDRP